MAKNSLEPENRLRNMMGLSPVESSTVVVCEEIKTESGFTFTGFEGELTLTSAPADAVDVDLATVVPDGYDGVSIAADAFANSTNLKSVTLCDKVKTIETGAFNGCDGVTLTLPKGCVLPALSGGSDNAPFTFGGSIELTVAEDDQKALLKAWPMQCLGYKNENEFQDYVFNIIWDLWGFSYEEADEAVNGPLLKQENYLRVLMRLPEISSTDELAYRYVVSEEQFPKSSSLSGEEAASPNADTALSNEFTFSDGDSSKKANEVNTSSRLSSDDELLAIKPDNTGISSAYCL